MTRLKPMAPGSGLDRRVEALADAIVPYTRPEEYAAEIAKLWADAQRKFLLIGQYPYKPEQSWNMATMKLWYAAGYHFHQRRPGSCALWLKRSMLGCCQPTGYRATTLLPITWPPWHRKSASKLRLKAWYDPMCRDGKLRRSGGKSEPPRFCHQPKLSQQRPRMNWSAWKRVWLN